MLRPLSSQDYGRLQSAIISCSSSMKSSPALALRVNSGLTSIEFYQNHQTWSLFRRKHRPQATTSGTLPCAQISHTDCSTPGWETQLGLSCSAPSSTRLRD